METPMSLNDKSDGCLSPLRQPAKDAAEDVEEDVKDAKDGD